MRKLLLAASLLLFVSVAKAEEIAVDLGFAKFILPLQLVNATELYDFGEGAGYPGLETVLAESGNFRLTGGAAATIGDSEAVPFVSIQTRLSEKFFDISDNNLWFGVWAGKRASVKNLSWGLNAGIKLW